MNNIQEKDWAEDDWHSHTGIDSSCDYCVTDAPAAEADQADEGSGCRDGDPQPPAART